MLNTIKSVIIGHAVGDALGVPVEFCSRESLTKNPVTKMIGFGTHNVPAGTWSDDTSMSLCALGSLSKGTVDFEDIMKNFGKWYYDRDFTATGEVFDIGNTCRDAIHNYFNLGYKTTECGLTSKRSNGNGSLMRINPFVLYAYYNKIENDEFIDIITKASALTHANQCSIDGCIIYSCVLKELINNPSKLSIYKGLSNSQSYISSSKTYYYRLFYCYINAFDIMQIKSSGYIVDTLEAAIWCLLTTKNYKDCVLKAVNLGEDTDTVAAVAGGLAGALYGFDDISTEWLHTLKKRDYIEKICEQAYSVWR